MSVIRITAYAVGLAIAFTCYGNTSKPLKQDIEACNAGLLNIRQHQYSIAIPKLEVCAKSGDLFSKPGSTAYYLLVLAYYYSGDYTKAWDWADIMVPMSKKYLAPEQYDFILNTILPSLDSRPRSSLSIDTMINPLMSEDDRRNRQPCEANPQCRAFQEASPEERNMALEDAMKGPLRNLKQGFERPLNPPLTGDFVPEKRLRKKVPAKSP